MMIFPVKTGKTFDHHREKNRFSSLIHQRDILLYNNSIVKFDQLLVRPVTKENFLKIDVFIALKLCLISIVKKYDISFIIQIYPITQTKNMII